MINDISLNLFASEEILNSQDQKTGYQELLDHTDKAKTSNPLYSVIDNLLNTPEPKENTARVDATSQIIQNGEYHINYSQLADNLIAEYLSESVSKDGTGE